METLWTGILGKMDVAAGPAPGDAVAYTLKSPQGPGIGMNALLGRRLRLEYTGVITCIACGRETARSFNQGFCWPCSQSRAEADICIVRPELCHYHDEANPCRDDAFARSVCFGPHVLYVSLTSGVKVGITRRPNVPSRWMDQGAVRAIPLAELPDRFSVGKLEAELARTYADKTHWARMLKIADPEGDLAGVAEEVVGVMRDMGVEGILPDAERIEYAFTYPVLEYPRKVTSFNLDKDPLVEGELRGIKAQYLIFDTGVINLRKYGGYHATLSEVS